MNKKEKKIVKEKIDENEKIHKNQKHFQFETTISKIFPYELQNKKFCFLSNK